MNTKEGDPFGCLTVLKLWQERDDANKLRWYAKVLCDCGAEYKRQLSTLTKTQKFCKACQSSFMTHTAPVNPLSPEVYALAFHSLKRPAHRSTQPEIVHKWRWDNQLQKVPA